MSLESFQTRLSRFLLPGFPLQPLLLSLAVLLLNPRLFFRLPFCLLLRALEQLNQGLGAMQS